MCGGIQKVEFIEIYHYKEASQSRWGARFIDLEAMVGLRGYSLTNVEIVMHPECASKALPHVPWGFS